MIVLFLKTDHYGFLPDFSHFFILDYPSKFITFWCYITSAVNPTTLNTEVSNH